MALKELVKKFIPCFVIGWYHYKLALLGAVFYGFPGKKIKVIGVTGTSGKSTTVDLISRILEEAGFKTASLSSVRFKISDKQWENNLKMTMPGRFAVQKFLRQAVNAGCKYMVLEVTSEGIIQHRHRFIDFNTAVFTNLSPEHIESHGGFENYRNAKLQLFKIAKNKHIINLDDENADYFLQIPAKERWGYGFKISDDKFLISNSQIISAKDFSQNKQGISFFVKGTQFKLGLFGEFNVYNSLAAISVGLSEGVQLGVCKKALERVETIPGRMEIVIREPFKVIVDYAHTPEALGKVYQTLTSGKRNKKTSKLICVLGSCGGGRDKWKRPALGELAKSYCKKIIITNEDPYDDDPMEIINEVAKGAGPKAEKILDRGEAIKQALASAKKNDVVIITGKGSEQWMCVENGIKIPWDDREVIKEEFQK